MSRPFVSVIIPAAGSGKRMKSSQKKQLMMINDKPLFIHTLLKFETHDSIDEIILVCPKEDKIFITDCILNYGIKKVSRVVDGGKERQDSVSNGLNSVSENASIILVHDAVRPFVQQQNIQSVIDALLIDDAAILAIELSDTIKQAKNGFVEQTLDRTQLWSVQTPQGMKANIFRNCYNSLKNESFLGTDEGMIAEHFRIPVRIVAGSKQNIKVTTSEDLYLVNMFMSVNNAD